MVTLSDKDIKDLNNITNPATRAVVINKFIYDAIMQERLNQDIKWGPMPRNNSPSLWSLVLGEEVGEVNRAILEGDGDNYVTELIQVAAVAIAAIEDYYTGRPERSIESLGKRIVYFLLKQAWQPSKSDESESKYIGFFDDSPRE